MVPKGPPQNMPERNPARCNMAKATLGRNEATRMDSGWHALLGELHVVNLDGHLGPQSPIDAGQ
jgi:hypothetical protein